MIFGMQIVKAPEFPRYTLPDDVPPPTGMTRAEFAAWSREVCGMVCSVPPGTAYVFGNTIVMRPLDAVRLMNIC